MRHRWKKLKNQADRRSPIQAGRLLFAAVIVAVVAVSFGQHPAAILAQDDRKGEGGFSSYLPLVTQQDCFRYIEENHLLVMEVEHALPVDHWAVETALPGFTGDSYYTWHGPNYFGNPGNAILTYPILINNPGEFNLRIHNRHDFPDPTEENDVWARMDSGPWVKAFSPVGGQWTWGTYFDLGHSQINASYLLSAGPHTLQISARSEGISIDRIHLHKNPAHENTSLPVSACS
jgi:hypothetical protein